MASFCVSSVSLFGLQATPVTVEVDISSGLPRFHIVGLPDVAISEAKERVRAAIKNSGFSFPRTSITINLAPANTRKQGAAYDLAIALAILGAQGVIKHPKMLQNLLILGELGLHGTIRPITGALLASSMGKAMGFSGLLIPQENLSEAQLVHDYIVYSGSSLRELVEQINAKNLSASPARISQENAAPTEASQYDFSLVAGQAHAKRALEIAAAGGHNALLYGPPGSGKTMLARAFASILPPPTLEESLEITAIHSVAGTLQHTDQLAQRPFRAPHHTTSGTALVGGGAQPRPGEVSLAHRGVLFLDEFPEFSRSVLENLRQPLEDGMVTVSRAAGTVTFPARFMLIASMNPCPCGFVGDPNIACTCPPSRVLQYQQKISGPLLDRIDLRIDVPRVSFDDISSITAAEPSSHIRERITRVRSMTKKRYSTMNLLTNAELKAASLKKFCVLSSDGLSLMQAAMERMRLSARSYGRILKVARTIADLNESENISEQHLAEALHYRPLAA